MRPALAEIERIENYVIGKMSTADKNNFEKELNDNPRLKRDVDIQSQITEGIKRIGLSQIADRSYKNYRGKLIWTKIILGILVAGIIALTAIILSKKDDNQEEVENAVEQSSLVEDQISLENDSLFTATNELLEQEFFELVISRDTVIETQDGVAIFIPAGSFTAVSDTIDFLVQTALKTEDILFAGLSTKTKNGEELETAGMIYIDAFEKGKRLPLEKELVVDVPRGDNKPGMQLYDGVKDEAGEIVWTNPRPIEKPLLPVDILTLDFYPPGYENKMEEWGYTRKGFVDSIYYAFNSDCDEKVSESRIAFEREDIRTIPQDVEVLSNWNQIDTSEVGNPAKGEKIFKGTCASCHFPDRDMTGPRLRGSRKRWIDNSSESNFYDYIRNSSALIASGDTYANNLFIDWNRSVMPAQKVTDQEIDHIMAYANSYRRRVEDDVQLFCGINPASIQTIWNQKFNNTNLATKEFEERIPWIHKTCNQEVLDIYIHNLDKNLSSVDSMAAKKAGGLRYKFMEFAKKGDGKVEVNSLAEEALTAYYETKRKAITDVTITAQKKYWSEQDSLNIISNGKNKGARERDNRNTADLEIDEIVFNTTKIYKELGIIKNQNRSPQISTVAMSDQNSRLNTSQREDLKIDKKRVNRIPVSMPNATFRLSIQRTGWKNIDCIVGATQNRETVKIIDRGKTTQLIYKDWSCKIEDDSKYTQVFVYLIPTAFTSYFKLKNENGGYSYKLNDGLAYKSLVLGWSGDEIYYNIADASSNSKNITLIKGDEQKIKTIIANELPNVKTLNAEVDYGAFMQKDKARQTKNRMKNELRNKARAIVFPCFDKPALKDEQIKINSPQIPLLRNYAPETFVFF